MHVPELIRMGADIKIEGRKAITWRPIKGAPVKPPISELRFHSLAGLVVEGHTEIDKIHHIDRGYEDIIEKLKSVAL